MGNYHCCHFVSLIMSLVIIIGSIVGFNQVASALFARTQVVALYTNLRGEQEDCAYVLKEYQGFVAVFKQGEEKPLETFNIKIETFSKQDRQRLCDGILYENLTALQKGLEDFCS